MTHKDAGQARSGEQRSANVAMGIKGFSKRHGHASGKSQTPTYRSWSAMRTRCLSKTDRNLRYYSGRGITVCARWQKFENFLADMGERPANTSLDRIDNDGNYEPGNCRWATPKEQANNQRRPKFAKFNDLSGTRYGRLTAVRINERGGRYGLKWECLCDCGKTIKTMAWKLRSGIRTSCGCLSVAAKSEKDKLIATLSAENISLRAALEWALATTGEGDEPAWAESARNALSLYRKGP